MHHQMISNTCLATTVVPHQQATHVQAGTLDKKGKVPDHLVFRLDAVNKQEHQQEAFLHEIHCCNG